MTDRTILDYLDFESEDPGYFKCYTIKKDYVLLVQSTVDETSMLRANYVQFIEADNDGPACWCIQLEGSPDNPANYADVCDVKYEIYYLLDKSSDHVINKSSETE